MDEKKAQILNIIKNNTEKFEAYNQLKRGRLYDEIKEPSITKLLDLIPLLLHTNFHGSPGYIHSEHMPVGIKDYTPAVSAIEYLHQRFPSVQVLPVHAPIPFIQMLALMGSGGTVAYTRESDFDFWVCYDERHHSQMSVDIFRKKCRDIENWILEAFNVQVHFYLNEISKVRNNIFAEDEENLAGSAIGVLLKEEFLRSSIILYGGIPFWWAVPAGTNTQTYNGWLKSIEGTEVEHTFLDLGNLHLIGPEDFLGAALFQIIKSLGSPFKSIIKLGLLERYLGSKDDDPFISSIIKKNIHADRLSNEETDAYIIMFNQVYDYYSSIVKNPGALEILKMSFYLKVEPKLFSHLQGASSEVSEKIRVLLAFVRKWGWDDKKIMQMDDFQNWGIDSVNKLLNSTKKFVLNGYKQILGNIEADKVKHGFSGDELQAITRKIYSHFQISADKIDNTLSFKTYPPEKLLKIEYIREGDGSEFWILSKRLIVRERPQSIIIHKDKSLFGLSIWISLNGLFLKDYTRLDIDAGLHVVDPNYLRELISEASLHFSYNRVELHDHYFLKDPFPLMSFLIFNPYSKYAKEVEEIFFLYHNSWGETKFEIFKHVQDIPAILTRILNGCLITKEPYENAVNIISLSPYRSSVEYIKFKAIMKELFTFFSNMGGRRILRFITKFHNNYVVFSTTKKRDAIAINHTINITSERLFFSLSNNRGDLNDFYIDKSLKELGYLNLIVENYRNNAIQIYFFNTRTHCHFFVSDEQGSIQFYKKDIKELFEYLTRLYMFAQNAIKETGKNNPDSKLVGSKNPIEVYQLKDEGRNQWRMLSFNPELSTRISEVKKRLIPLDFILNIDENGQIEFQYLLLNQRFSKKARFKQEHIRILAETFKVLKGYSQNVSYFITGISVTNIGDKSLSSNSSFLFTLKNRIETMVEREFSQSKST